MGLERLTKLSGAFGDTLSYLRLFALGLASASLAVSFNDIAQQLHTGVPGFGLLLALLVLLIGHGLNIVIAISSGFIHGLRLNFIEFFNWSGCGEGYPFKAFRRKEKSSWIT
jgi:V/A-type H+/Na+-transporting ATPase subunit I